MVKLFLQNVSYLKSDILHVIIEGKQLLMADMLVAIILSLLVVTEPIHCRNLFELTPANLRPLADASWRSASGARYIYGYRRIEIGPFKKEKNYIQWEKIK